MNEDLRKQIEQEIKQETIETLKDVCLHLLNYHVQIVDLSCRVGENLSHLMGHKEFAEWLKAATEENP